MPLPFDLPALSRGAAELSGEARAVGAEAAEAAARALSALLGRDVALRGRAVAWAAAPRGGARLALELASLPGRAALDLDAALVVRLVDLLAGGTGEIAGATALTPLEEAAAELFALAALDGVCAIPAVEETLAPRLARLPPEAGEPLGALAVELELAAGDVAGRARLLLPAAAARALRGAADPLAPGHALVVPASVRGGEARLLPEELDALALGDVVLFDPAADGLQELVLPGGARLRGRREDDPHQLGDPEPGAASGPATFHLEETAMTNGQGQLPITLEVELARVELTVGELARLEPGAALPLAVDRRGLVTLRAGERAVARGELVDIDGAVGVRILSLELPR